ncbi:hypothetical protein Cni_G01061 [Canna indica]|uniref:Uncharacterized protein n=1 Tax=Canna indica TaxID=4628 RepID=A0AAQ3PXN3_9LILI|nr:hypothetical protein Cni_G01061 [Canna indica]
MAVSPDLFSVSSNLLLCPEDAHEVASWEEEDDEELPEHQWSPLALNDDHSSALSSLLAAESAHLPRPDFLNRLNDCAVDATARHDAVNWILKARYLLPKCPSFPNYFMILTMPIVMSAYAGERVLPLPAGDRMALHQLPRPVSLLSLLSGN